MLRSASWRGWTPNRVTGPGPVERRDPWDVDAGEAFLFGLKRWSGHVRSVHVICVCTTTGSVVVCSDLGRVMAGVIACDKQWR